LSQLVGLLPDDLFLDLHLHIDDLLPLVDFGVFFDDHLPELSEHFVDPLFELVDLFSTPGGYGFLLLDGNPHGLFGTLFTLLGTL
jgi:hypothetical protein